MAGVFRRNDSSGTVRWYVKDGLGSVLAEAGDPDANNNPIKSTRKMDVYGLQRQTTGTPTSNHRFVGNLGHTTDDATGLIYMRARYMDPITGTFVSEDPKRDSVNWFGYCQHNITNQVDPKGLFVEDVVKEERDIATLGWAQGKIAQAYGMALGNLIGAIIGVENLAISFNMKTSQMFYKIIMNGRELVVRLDLSGHAGYPAHINTWIPPGQPGHQITLDCIETLIEKLTAI